jgi:hypothetical protein
LALAKETAPSASLLPRQFGGWQISGSSQISVDPAIADPVNAAVLKEYGFTGFESATYTRDDGRKLAIKAARFADASGAYGAYTYYKTREMLSEQIGDGAASMNQRVLFYRGNIVVDAVFFQELSAMSAAELRELAQGFPLPEGNTRNLPDLPVYLPTQSYVKNTAKYVVGPEALQKINPPISAELVDFNLGAEVVVGTYNSPGGEATLMLISYPTPQIAADHLRRIEAARQGTSQPGGNMPATSSAIPQGPIFDKRSGPMVVIAAGPLSQDEAKALLATVNYDAKVTWNENTSFGKGATMAKVVMNGIILSLIIAGLALVAGVAFGGLRILAQRWFPGRGFDRVESREFISLHLSETPSETLGDTVSPSIKAG